MSVSSKGGPDSGIAQAFLDASTDGVSIVDESGAHIWINEAFCRMTGFEFEDLAGSKPPHPYWCDSDINRIADAFAETLEGSPKSYELFFQHKDGHRIPVIVSACEFKDDGKTYYAATVKDMSEIEHRSDELTHTETLVETMMRGGDICTWDWPLSDGQPTVSNTYFTILDYEPGDWEPNYEEWAKRVHPEDIGAADLSMQNLLSDKSRMYDAEFRMLTADGEWRWLLARGYVTERTADNQPARITGTMQDIHRFKAQEDKLRQFQKMEVLGQLTAGIAHDFNNILAIVYGSLEVLRMTVEPAQQDGLNNAFQSLDRARNLTRSLLNMTRVDASGATEVNVVEVLEGMRAVFDTGLQKGCALELRHGKDELPVTIDRALLENALLNLVLNARDAIEEQDGRIQVSCEPELVAAQRARRLGVESGEYCVIQVSDNGRGMNTETLESATEPLFTTKPHGQGTGLGLSMVKRLVDEAKGFMRIESTEGDGTTVELGFPLMDAPIEVPDAPVEATAVLGRKILVVDDESELLDIVASQLDRLGYNVLKVENPRRALSELQTGDVDLLLTDLAMPYTIDGVELARRSLAICSDLKVLFMTGYADETITSKAARMGPVLYKPFSIDRLAQFVRDALDHGDA